ncbi:MAG: four helix bundle protein [Planctomycetota bacterium]
MGRETRRPLQKVGRQPEQCAEVRPVPWKYRLVGGQLGIVDRTAEFADRIIQLCLALPSNSVGWEIGRQLIRAGTSVGANVEEAQAGESKADFIHKMRIARKECREARFFLRRIANAKLIQQRRLESLLGEVEQILLILTTIILRATERDVAATQNNKKQEQTRGVLQRPVANQ